MVPLNTEQSYGCVTYERGFEAIFGDVWEG